MITAGVDHQKALLNYTKFILSIIDNAVRQTALNHALPKKQPRERL